MGALKRAARRIGGAGGLDPGPGGGHGYETNQTWIRLYKSNQIQLYLFFNNKN